MVMDFSIGAGIAITVGSGGAAGVAAVPLAAAVAIYGTGLSAKSASNLRDDLRMLFSKNNGSSEGTGNVVKPNDVVPYRPSSSPLENHHGVLDVWAKHNVPNYQSRGANTPTIALTKEQHDATKEVYRNWLYEKQEKSRRTNGLD